MTKLTRHQRLTSKISLFITLSAIMLVLVAVAAQAKPAEPCLSLPQEPVKMRVSYPGSISEFKTTLMAVPEGYDVADGTYLGWCKDKNKPIHSRVTYEVILYPSSASNLPVYLQDKPWDMVNYILNHKQSSNRQEIQAAIWYFTNGGEYPSAPKAQALVDDVLENGAGFVPEAPQVTAVICDAGSEVQPTTIEVVLPRCTYTFDENSDDEKDNDDNAVRYNCFKLPQAPVEMRVAYPGDKSEFKTTLADIPEGYDVADGRYLGWCHDEKNPIYSWKSYKVALYSSCAKNLPAYLPADNWNLVNYLLNHKQSHRWADVRAAIWYFTYRVESLSDNAQTLVNDAMQNGGDFVPEPGQVIAVICDAGPEVQVTFIEVVLPECVPLANNGDEGEFSCLSLPKGPVKMNVSYPGNISEFKTNLMAVPEGYDVSDGTYLGWCNDENKPIHSRVTYEVILYPSSASNLPVYLQDKPWDMVNYILNHKQSSNRQEIQAAIWYFTNGGEYPSAPKAQALVDDVLENGAGFVPEAPQVTAVICDAGSEVQPTTIEVVLPRCTYTFDENSDDEKDNDDNAVRYNCFKLPQAPVEMRVAYPGDKSEFKTTLADIPEGYDVADGRYLGWCHDEKNPIYSWKSYKVALYSSCAKNLPAYLPADNWNLVNYLLNHKQSHRWADVRAAIWYFTYRVESLSDNARTLVNDAMQNGGDFVPEPGQVIAVICDAGPEVQVTFIELVLPSCIPPIAPELSEVQITQLHAVRDNIPLQTRLRANYPNPFNPETWIPFELAEDTNIKVEIYDTTGRIIRMLDLGYRPAGHYVDRATAAHWDGRNFAGERVASGVYLYRLTTGDFAAVRKMVVMK